MEPKNNKLWTYLRWNSFVSERHKLFYVSTPKVACTSLKWWFADLEGCSERIRSVTDSIESDQDLAIHDCFHRVAPAVTGLRPNALKSILISESYFRFAVVRNPYKRIFSAWQSKLLLREPFQVGPYTTCEFFNKDIRTLDDVAEAFEGFLEHLSNNEAPEYLDIHWTPQVELLRPDLIKYTYISQIENLKDLTSSLAAHLGENVTSPFEARHANESLIPYSPMFITQKSEDLVLSLFGKDFDAFGYQSSIPEAKEDFTSSQLEIALKAIHLIRGRHQQMTYLREKALEQRLKAPLRSIKQGITEWARSISSK